MKTEIKPGYRTTEFWLTLGASLATAALTHAEQVSGTAGVVAVAVLTAIYTILRAAAKAKG